MSESHAISSESASGHITATTPLPTTQPIPSSGRNATNTGAANSTNVAGPSPAPPVDGQEFVHLTEDDIKDLDKKALEELKSKYELGPGKNWPNKVWRIARPVSSRSLFRTSLSVTYPIQPTQKVAQWFPYHNNQLNKENKEAKQAAKLAKSINNLATLIVQPPRKAQASQEYSRRLWDEGVGEVFDDEWRTQNEAEEPEVGGTGCPSAHIGDRSQFARRMWNAESEEVKATLKEEIEKDFVAQQMEYKTKLMIGENEGKKYEW